MFETLDDSQQSDEKRLRTDDDSQDRDEAFSSEGAPTLLFFCAAGLMFTSFFFGNSSSMRAFTALTYLTVAVFTIGVFWRLRSRVSFWVVFSVILLLHIPVVLYSPLSTFWLHNKGLFFVSLADFLIYLAGVLIIDRLIGSLKKMRKRTS